MKGQGHGVIKCAAGLGLQVNTTAHFPSYFNIVVVQVSSDDNAMLCTSGFGG